MKNLLLLIVLTTTNIFAQVTISTEKRAVYTYADSSYIEEYEVPFYSVIEFSNNKKSFKHITEEMTSFYTVESEKIDTVQEDDTKKEYEEYVFIVVVA